MNDLPLHIDNNIDMFADDSTLYTSGHNVDEIQRSLQTNLNAVTTWCEDNRMVLNVAKTKCMLITTKQRRHHLRNNQLAITLNDQELQQVNTLPAKDGDLRLSASNACLPKTEISVFVTECVFFTSTCYKLHMFTLHDVQYS